MSGFCEFAKENCALKLVHHLRNKLPVQFFKYTAATQAKSLCQPMSFWLYFVIKMVRFYKLKSASIVAQALTCSLGCGTVQLSAISVPNPIVIFYQFWPFYKVSQLFSTWTSTSKQVISILGCGSNRYSIPIGLNSWAKKVTFLVKPFIHLR